ncbi:hypothetical protein [Gordonibacter sp.]|uniref:hypothetical protein n=1 Tax=Gordonibacter sp. TaxID=1968902 RepID=UPI0025C5AE62|nr:hypothetical protein [Gordonibacter sp.]
MGEIEFHGKQLTTFVKGLRKRHIAEQGHCKKRAKRAPQAGSNLAETVLQKNLEMH